MNIAIVLFPDVEELDFAGPYEVFGMAAKHLFTDWRLYTVAEASPVRGATGLSINADHSFDDAPHADVLVVPGGQGTRPGADNERLMAYIRRAGEQATWVTSVCTGAFLLHRAGFLAGKRATTHWGSRQRLKDAGVDVVEARWVHDGNVITAAGVSAGIDMALYLIGQIKTPKEARDVQRMIEYDPAPPYEGVASRFD
jgi:transcriptional regulator GlxA family with amidase domain